MNGISFSLVYGSFNPLSTPVNLPDLASADDGQVRVVS